MKEFVSPFDVKMKIFSNNLHLKNTKIVKFNFLSELNFKPPTKKKKSKFVQNKLLLNFKKILG